MNRIITLAVAGMIVASATSCTWVRFNPSRIYPSEESGVIGNLVQNITQADEFTFNLPAEIVYVQTNSDPYLIIKGKGEQIGNVEVYQNDNSVTVRRKPAIRLGDYGNLKILVGTSDLRKVQINSACEFTIEGGLTTDSFAISSNGASEIEIDRIAADNIRFEVNGAGDATLSGIDCKTLCVTVNGAGDITLGGRCTLADVSISGTGEIDALNLDVDELRSNVSGLGEIKRRKKN